MIFVFRILIQKLNEILNNRAGATKAFAILFYLCSIVYSNLNESTLLVVEDTVVGILPVAVVVELHASRQALWVLRRHQYPVWNSWSYLSCVIITLLMPLKCAGVTLTNIHDKQGWVIVEEMLLSPYLSGCSSFSCCFFVFLLMWLGTQIKVLSNLRHKPVRFLYPIECSGNLWIYISTFFLAVTV